MGSRSLLDMVHSIGRSEQLEADLAQPDAVLLERFVRHRDEAAFEAILHRHGPLVHTVCRRMLYSPDDAADAFQATFLVLARKAGAIGSGSLLAGWLFGVAYRVAARARKDRLRRETREQFDVDMTRFPASEEPRESAITRELCEEVQRLPQKYREPILLCYLEGKTIQEAANELNCPATTIKGRLALARDMLRQRLTRHGVTLTAGLLAGNAAAAPAPAALIAEVLKAAPSFADGMAVGAVSMQVVALAKGVLRTMLLTKIKTVVAVLLTVGLLTGTGGALYQTFAADKPADEKKADKPKAGKPKADAEAILGTWKAVSMEYDGVKNPAGAEFDLLKTMKVTFTKEKHTIELAGGTKDYKYKLDPSTKPKSLDLDGDVSVKGVYALAGDKLTMCLPNAGKGGGKRPDKLTTTKEDGRMLVVLKREGKERAKDK